MKDNTLSWMSNDISRGSNKFSGNQSGKTGLTNAGRGPTGGGTAMPKCGCEMTSAGKFPQKRQAVGDGATTAMPKTGKESFDFGRGPTKGNQR